MLYCNLFAERGVLLETVPLGDASILVSVTAGIGRGKLTGWVGCGHRVICPNYSEYAVPRETRNYPLDHFGGRHTLQGWYFCRASTSGIALPPPFRWRHPARWYFLPLAVT